MKKKILVTIAALGTVLTGCSGGAGDKPSTPSTPPSGPSYGDSINSQFIDAPVKGLKLQTAYGVKSQTGDEGKFSCKRGEIVSFSLGGLDLGYAACGDKIFVQDLTSKLPNYSWQQAAAVLQTFSVNNTTYLDLSELDQTKLDLSAVAYDNSLTGVNLSSVLATALTSGAYEMVSPTKMPVLAVNATSAETAANASFASNVSLKTEFKSVLHQLNAGGPSSIILNGILISESFIPGLEEDESCWKNIKVKSEVSKVNGVYSFNINSAFSYDKLSDIGTGDSCSVAQEDNVLCEIATRLPKSKMISSESVDMISSADYPLTPYNYTEQNVLSLSSNFTNNQVNFSGIYEAKMTINDVGPLKDKSFVCKYKITGSKIIQAAASSSNDKYSGALACSDAGANPIAASVKTEVEMSGTYPNIIATVKIFNNNILAWTSSSLSFEQIPLPLDSSMPVTLGVFASGTVNTDIGPIANGNSFTLTKYNDDKWMASKLTLSLGTPSSHCDSYNGLTRE